MEFIKANFFNTSTQITVNNNTATAENLFNRDLIYQYFTDGMNDDTTSTSITITFDLTTSVSRLALIGMNFKEFSFFYDGATANAFSLEGDETTTSFYTGNADINKYFKFSTVACTSITIEAKSTMIANEEKYIGLLVVSDTILELTQIPDAKGYKPVIIPKQIVHTLSDGGTRIHNVKKKWFHTLNLAYINTTQRDGLYSLYQSGSEFNFTPFGTSTSWDGICFEAVWDGKFGFYQYSDNAIASGFSGQVSIKETPI